MVEIFLRDIALAKGCVASRYTRFPYVCCQTSAEAISRLKAYCFSVLRFLMLTESSRLGSLCGSAGRCLSVAIWPTPLATYVCDIPGVSAGGGVETGGEGFLRLLIARPPSGNSGERLISKDFSKDFKVT